jgi:tRNA (uracil-5-)-methyltransferase TRM9
MDLDTRHALDAINSRFYASAAEEFSSTRSHPWPGWERLVPHLAPPVGATRSLRVLDVGCGNGRLAAFLAEHLDGDLEYLGIDRSPGLLEHAREQNAGLPRARFECVDILGDELEARDLAFPRDFAVFPRDLIALFGILHHVPGFETRRSLLARLVGGLAPGGLFAVAAWQFAAFERFRARMLPWSALESHTGLHVDASQLEPGDYLLRWGDAERVRYCHFVDEEELQSLLPQSGAELVESYAADGREGTLNRYVVLRRQP